MLFGDATPPAAAAVYAVDTVRSDRDGYASYAMTRIEPPETAFSLSVPPGLYKVVARLDSDPFSAAGYTFNMECSATTGPCAGTQNNPALDFLTVESKHAVTGINVGDWGTQYGRQLLWAIDTNGSPLDPASARARTLPTQSLPAPRLLEATSELTTRWSGVKLTLPANWHVAVNPNPYAGNADYYASEAVS